MKYFFILFLLNKSFAQDTISFYLYPDSTYVYFLKNKKHHYSKSHNLIEEISWDHCNYCEGARNGLYISKHENGNLSQIGTYDCNEKINTWMTYYESGKIKKIETYLKPYDSEFFDNFTLLLNLKNKPLHSGPYIEYDTSGRVVIEGMYKIYEEFSEIDSFILYNPETYIPYDSIVKKRCWIPQSIKTGIWYMLNHDGTYDSIDYSEINKNRKLRLVGTRYTELQIAKYKKRK